MNPILKQRLADLSATEHVSSIVGIRRGLERECLRIQSNGTLAPTTH
ncbi:MAG: glutamate--cysteine ligase, partial [Alkalimonas sp.]|nr:glutamate--cysteine ligase [Alkalimonas sp.]